MLLANYTQANLLCNVSINGKTSNPGEFVYRGDLVLEEGEIADAQGRRKPPVSVIRQAIVLATEAKITLLIGALAELQLITLALERYAGDFSDGVALIFFIENINKPLQVELGKFKAVLLPIVDTSVWNETLDELHLEKDDFKGQSAEDKIVTIKNALSDYRPKYETVALESALQRTVAVKREGRGAV